MSRKEEIEARKLELRDEIEAAEDAEKVETFIINGVSIFANKSEEFTFNEFKYFNNEKLNKISEDCFKNSNIKESEEDGEEPIVSHGCPLPPPG